MENQPHSNKQYKPISSDFYDELEAAATTNQICEIIYQDQNGLETKVISQIKDLYTEHGVEYARLENQVVRLDSIVNLNGKSDGSGRVDLNLLQQDMLPDTTAGINAQSQTNQTAVFTETNTSRTDIPDNTITEHGDRSMGLTSTAPPSFIEYSSTNTAGTDALVHGNMHQNEIIQDNLLGDSSATHPSEYPIQKDEDSDFVHRFTTSVTPFLVAENQFYNLTADRMRNRLYLKVFKSWDEPEQVTELGGYFSRIAPLMNGTFTLLNDLTALRPDESSTLTAPGVPNKHILLNAGLVKVADLVPFECDTLVHGLHSFSVNSLRVRYFKDRLQAEHWLGDDYRDTGTPDDLSLN